MKRSGQLASAPGKLVLAGEYAVLEGHPALVAAVDRRATSMLQAGPDQLSITGLGKGPFVVEDTGTGVRLVGDEADDLRLVRAVLDELVKAGIALPGGRLSVDSSALNVVDHGGKRLKLGLGSSAAATCAVVACLAAAAGDKESAADPFPLAWAAHHAFSLGRGSGIDVAASARGGLVEFTRTDEGPLCKSVGRLPANLAVVVTFTGQSQDTRSFLDAVTALKERDRSVYDDIIGEQAEATARLLEGIEGAEPPAIIEAAGASRRAMARLGEAAGIDIISEPHRRAAEVAERFGGTAKPSGAGGGDVALCFVPVEERTALQAALVAAGLSPVKLALGAVGARAEGLH